MDEAASVAPTQGGAGNIGQAAVPVFDAHAGDEREFDAYCNSQDLETKIVTFIKETGLVDATDDQTHDFLQQLHPLMYRKRIIKLVGSFFCLSSTT